MYLATKQILHMDKKTEYVFDVEDIEIVVHNRVEITPWLHDEEATFYIDDKEYSEEELEDYFEENIKEISFKDFYYKVESEISR